MPPSIDTGETEKKVVSTAEELPVNAPPLNLNDIVTELEKPSNASDQGKKDSNQIQSENAPSLAEAQTEKEEI